MNYTQNEEINGLHNMILCIEVYIVQLWSTSKNEEINGLHNIILKEGVTGRAGVLMSNIKVCTDQLYILHNTSSRFQLRYFVFGICIWYSVFRILSIDVQYKSLHRLALYFEWYFPKMTTAKIIAKSPLIINIYGPLTFDSFGPRLLQGFKQW